MKPSSYLFFSLVFFALFLSSCEKDGNIENDYYISFKANDVFEEYTSENSLSGLWLDGDFPNRFSTDADKLNGAISLAVYDMKALVNTTYKGLVVKQSSTQYSVVGAEIGYKKDNANYASGRLGTSDVSITITEITSKTVRGKFIAKVYGAAQVEIVITDGEFFVPIDIPEN